MLWIETGCFLWTKNERPTPTVKRGMANLFLEAQNPAILEGF